MVSFDSYNRFIDYYTLYNIAGARKKCYVKMDIPGQVQANGGYYLDFGLLLRLWKFGFV